MFDQVFQVFYKKTKEKLGNYQVFQVFQGFQSLVGQPTSPEFKLTTRKPMFYQVLYYSALNILLKTCVLPGFLRFFIKNQRNTWYLLGFPGFSWFSNSWRRSRLPHRHEVICFAVKTLKTLKNLENLINIKFFFDFS